MPIPLPAIGLMAAIIFLGIFIIINSNKPKREQDASQQKFLRKAYEFASTFFLTQGQIIRIYNRLSVLSIYNRSELQVITVKYMLITSGISVGLVAASIFLFRDTISTLICIAFAGLVNNILVNKQIEKVNLKVHKALRYSISSIRQEYMKLGSVSESILEADIHPMLTKSFDEIYNILTNADGELRLLQFYESSPFRSLQTLAGICYNIHNYGDEVDNSGQSNFIQALTMLVSDVNSEMQRLITMKTKFGYIEYLPFVPIFTINLIEGYFSSIMPGTTLIYNGLIGYIGRVLTLVCSILCYNIVANINTSAPIKEDDRIHWINNLLLKDKFKQFIYNIIPKNVKGLKVENNLKKALSRKSLEHLYTEKLMWSVVAFVVAVIVAFSIISLSRDFTMNSTQQLSLIASDEMEGYEKEQILELDYSYFERTREWTDEEFMDRVRSAMPGLTDLQVFDQMKRIRDKEKALNASYFHWYYMVICIAVSVVAWFGPNILLILRKFLVYTESEDDFLQLQTLIAILMNTEMDTLDVLWQMCQHSRIHKDMLMYCYHSYPSNPEKELTRLQSKTPLVEFKRFIGKFALTIRDLSLKEAFSDLKIEREHMTRVREISMYATIDKRRSLCGPISVAPLGFLVVFDLLIPLGYLGFMEFMNALGSMG